MTVLICTLEFDFSTSYPSDNHPRSHSQENLVPLTHIVSTFQASKQPFPHKPTPSSPPLKCCPRHAVLPSLQSMAWVTVAWVAGAHIQGKMQGQCCFSSSSNLSVESLSPTPPSFGEGEKKPNLPVHGATVSSILNSLSWMTQFL